MVGVFLDIKLLTILLVFFLHVGFINADILVSAEVLNNKPTVPILNIFENVYGVSLVNLTWHESFDFENDSIAYFLRVGSNPDSNNILYIQLFDNQYTLPISLGKQYFWAVKACDNYYGDYNNCSEWSLEDSFYALSKSSSSKKFRSSFINYFGCKDLKGIICSDDEVCYDTVISTYDADYCCLSKCILKSDIGNIFELENKIYNLELYSDINENLKYYSIDDSLLTYQKRFLTNKELLLTVTLKSYGIIDVFGKPKYRAYVFITAKNISNFVFEDFELIVDIPKDFVTDVNKVYSNNLFSIIKQDTIIKYYLGNLNSGNEKTVDYYFDTFLDFNQIKSIFINLNSPIGLIRTNELDSCYGVLCNDFNPCTNDFCYEGECKYVDNQTCNKNICSDFKCIIQKILNNKEFKLNYSYIIYLNILIIFLILIFLLNRLFRNGDFKG